MIAWLQSVNQHRIHALQTLRAILRSTAKWARKRWLHCLLQTSKSGSRTRHCSDPAAYLILLLGAVTPNRQLPVLGKGAPCSISALAVSSFTTASTAIRTLRRSLRTSAALTRTACGGTLLG